jgi:hypothetical protein
LAIRFSIYSDETVFLFVTIYALIIPLVVCTRIVLRAINGQVKGDKLNQKINDFFSSSLMLMNNILLLRSNSK